MIFAGLSVSSDSVSVVVMEQSRDGNFTLGQAQEFRLQSGDRAKAYARLHKQLADFFEQRTVESVCLKESAVSLGGTKKGHLLTAELRGVAQAAAASVSEVHTMNKAATSRNFGTRKVDEYLKDDRFWVGKGLKDLAKGKREAAFCVLCQFSKP